MHIYSWMAFTWEAPAETKEKFWTHLLCASELINMDLWFSSHVLQLCSCHFGFSLLSEMTICRISRACKKPLSVSPAIFGTPEPVTVPWCVIIVSENCLTSLWLHSLEVSLTEIWIYFCPSEIQSTKSKLHLPIIGINHSDCNATVRKNSHVLDGRCIPFTQFQPRIIHSRSHQ